MNKKEYINNLNSKLKNWDIEIEGFKNDIENYLNWEYKIIDISDLEEHIEEIKKVQEKAKELLDDVEMYLSEVYKVEKLNYNQQNDLNNEANEIINDFIEELKELTKGRINA